MSKPINWYDMDDNAQRAWQRQESERQDLEHERDQAREAAERDQARHKRQMASYRDEVEAIRVERAELEEAAEEAGEELDYVNRFLRERKLMEDYQSWRKEVG